MRLSSFSIGIILMFKYPTHSGASGAVNHITQDWHPALIVGVPHAAGRPRFRDSLYQIVPTTSAKSEYKSWSSNRRLYPLVSARDGGFEKDSLVLLDQVLTVDLNYYFLQHPPCVRVMGKLNRDEMQAIMAKLVSYFEAQDCSGLE